MPEAFAVEARDLTELFRALYDATARVMDATVFFFALYDEASETVQVVRQVDRGVEHPGGSFPLGKGFTSEAVALVDLNVQYILRLLAKR